MSEFPALYERDGDAFVGTGATKGPWHDGQSGGAVLALLGHCLEDVPTLAPMSLTRLTVDFVRPAPVGEPLLVSTRPVREGKKIQVVDLAVTVRGAECARARALRIRDAEIDPRSITSTTDADPAAVLPPPSELPGVENRPGVAPFLVHGAELRRTFEPIGDVHGLWTRLRLPVVAGEPTRKTSRASFALDVANMIGVSGTRDGLLVSMINADVSGHLYRPPRGEWIAMTGHTWLDAEVGHGMSAATMSDRDGVFGVTSTSQILQPVERLF